MNTMNKPSRVERLRILLEREVGREVFSDEVKFKLHPEGEVRMRQPCEEQERTFATERTVSVEILSLDSFLCVRGNKR